VRRVVFAYPGDLSALTGGYGYDRQVIAELAALGHPVERLRLPGNFPDPCPAEEGEALARLAAVPSDNALIVDGLAYGALAGDGLTAVPAPMVALVHHPLALETGIDPARAPAIATRERAALTQAAAILVTSSHTRDTLVADYAVPFEAVTVACPGLDVGWQQAEARRPVTPPRIAAVGSVLPRKGYDVLVAALAQLTDVPWSLAIAGSLDRAPETADALRRQIDAAQLADRVLLLGEAEADEIRGLYREATVFALPSRYEGFGMVFAEAMASGLPVVAARAGAVPEVVPSEAGILVDVDDVPATAAALRRILTDGALASRLSAGAAAAAERFHGWEETGRIVSRLVGRMEGA
jgi:glycosyltransferase involved in cell wall biosynthesis